MRKITIDIVKKEFEKEGYELLTKEYKNQKTILEFLCDKGHKNKIRYNEFYSGNRCKDCNGGVKFTYEQIQNKFKERGFKLLSTEYKNAHQKLEYECPVGHKCYNTYNAFNVGGGCLECSGKRKKTYEEVKQFFINEGYELLTIKKEYKNVTEKVQYKCNKGHINVMSVTHFTNKANPRRCPTCAIENNSGENHYKYNPNISDEERNDKRQTKKNTIWRNTVYQRDDYTCQKCKTKGVNLNAHHISNYSSNKRDRFSIKNGVTFCIDCHNAFHKIYGKENNNLKQLNEFLTFDFKPQDFNIKSFLKIQTAKMKNVNKIKKLREEGLSVVEIAEKLKTTKSQVNYYVRNLGFETYNNNSKLGEDKIELLRACFEDGMMPKKTAEKTGINYNTIRKYFTIFKKEM